jgi:hypothetical protein
MTIHHSIYQSPDQRMIDRQAEIITHNNKEFVRLHETIRRIEWEKEQLRAKAEMYDKIVSDVMKHEALQSIWNDLVVTMKMLDADKKF